MKNSPPKMVVAGLTAGKRNCVLHGGASAKCEATSTDRGGSPHIGIHSCPPKLVMAIGGSAHRHWQESISDFQEGKCVGILCQNTLCFCVYVLSRLL